MGKKGRGKQRRQEADNADSSRKSQSYPKHGNTKSETQEQQQTHKQSDSEKIQHGVKQGDAIQQTHSHQGQQSKGDDKEPGPSQLGAKPKQYPQNYSQKEHQNIGGNQQVGAWGKPKGPREPKQSTSVNAEEHQNRGRQQQSSTTSGLVDIPQVMHVPREAPQNQVVVQHVNSSNKPQSTMKSAPAIDTQLEGDDDILSGVRVPNRKGGVEYRAKTTVIVNYFPMNLDKLEEALHYDVAIVPDKPKKAFPAIMEEFRRRRFDNRHPAFDGSKSLYSSSPLFDCDEATGTVKIPVDGVQREYEVTIKLVAKLDLTCFRNYIQYVSENILEYNKSSSPLQCVNVILSNIPSLSYVRIGRSYFSPPEIQISLEDGCVLYRGFSQSALLRWKPFLNVDVANKAFTVAINVVDLVKEMFPRADLRRGLQTWDCDSLTSYLKGLKIKYEIGPMKRTWTVNALSLSAERATFVTAEGKRNSVAEYFRDVKKLKLEYPKLPTLWVGNQQKKNKILLPLECCTVFPDQPVSRNMTNKQVKNMIDAVSTNTTKRLETIKKCVKDTNYNQHPIMKEFSLSIDTKPQEVDARILKPPTLQYKNESKGVRAGVWTCGKFSEAMELNKWTIVCLNDHTVNGILVRLGEQFVELGKQVGFKINAPSPAFKRIHEMEHLQDYFKENKDLQLIVVILNYKQNCYSEVKKISELIEGSLTQCIKPTTRITEATVKSILLKINAKLNGENHHIQNLQANLPQFVREPCMIMGADVTHPGSSNFPSVAAVTASFDVNFFKYTFDGRLQPPRKEIIEDLKEITRQRLLYYYRQNNRAKPRTIFYIRDGVSEGQFIDVLKVELNAIKAACTALEGDYQPAIVFIVVQKRHRTRFFPTDSNIVDDKKNLNVPAGTCVDTIITHPTIVDFFLVSHASIRGVARPTKYVKLWDDIGLSEDDLEKFMYYLCHMYARCNRSVSYPAPTYYAHLAAARFKAYCDKNINTNDLRGEQEKLEIHEDLRKKSPMFFA